MDHDPEGDDLAQIQARLSARLTDFIRSRIKSVTPDTHTSHLGASFQPRTINLQDNVKLHLDIYLACAIISIV